MLYFGVCLSCLPIHLNFFMQICSVCRYLLSKAFLTNSIFKNLCSFWTLKNCHNYFKIFHQSNLAVQCACRMQVLVPLRFKSLKHSTRLMQKHGVLGASFSPNQKIYLVPYINFIFHNQSGNILNGLGILSCFRASLF